MGPFLAMVIGATWLWAAVMLYAHASATRQREKDYTMDLSDLPKRMLTLPLDSAGRPVPRFVEWLDGKPDFRVMSADHIRAALRFNLCWVCGQQLGSNVSFVIGPMCAINRVSAEPPSHLECATWSATHCPFLVNPQKVRREGNLPDEAHVFAGTMLEHNPGVTLVWTTRKDWGPRAEGNGVLWHIGEPSDVDWYAYGRRATRTEVVEAIERGLPLLAEVAAQQKGGPEKLAAQVAAAQPLLP